MVTSTSVTGSTSQQFTWPAIGLGVALILLNDRTGTGLTLLDHRAHNRVTWIIPAETRLRIAYPSLLARNGCLLTLTRFLKAQIHRTFIVVAAVFRQARTPTALRVTCVYGA